MRWRRAICAWRGDAERWWSESFTAIRVHSPAEFYGRLCGRWCDQRRTMRLYLIRHGQTEMNASHTIDTDYPGANLTERGREQAVGIVERLAGETVDAIWVSSLIRTHQTAAPLAANRGLVPVQREGLREIEAGIWEGGNDEAAYRGYLSTIERWFTDSMDEPMGGTITGRQALMRFDAVVREIESTEASNVAIFSHGSMLSWWCGMRVAGLTWKHYIDGHLDNTGMCVAEGSLDTGYRALSWMGETV
ncbi:MAG: histidine phosphatase family protein [Actinomycetaceae bacterium]|nr:histidine phosphatase family protein [Actinomycetaceae bacterium]